MRCVRCLGIGLLACGWSTGAWAEAAAILGEHQQVLVNLIGGLPDRWMSCADSCTGSSGRRAAILDQGAGGSRLHWDVPGDPAATQALGLLEYAAEVGDTGSDAVLTLTSREPFQGIRLIHHYALSLAGYTLSASLQVPAGARLVLESGESFVPQPLPGLASMYGKVNAVRVSATGQAMLSGDETPAIGVAVAGGQWLGVRNRFWALLVRPATDVTVDVHMVAPNRPRLDVQRGRSARSLDAVLYAGPVERARLLAVDPVLGGLLFAALWDWLRELSFGLQYLLERWYGVVGSYGVAVLLLSLSVKILMWPLTLVAERWQDEVDRIRSALKPELDAVGREFRGEEAHRRILEAYRQHGVSPSFAVRSLLGFLIQIPIFIAAFDMLGENFGLNGSSFLWIGDLALPDRWVALPTTLPFFGGHVNLLPFLMTFLTLLAARVQEYPSLSPELHAGQRRRLYAMAVVFFVSFYTFPAGMVLYWTANNLWHLLRILAGRAFAQLR
jgi:YidC/Oxa1 family membrane protein insertase